MTQDEVPQWLADLLRRHTDAGELLVTAYAELSADPPRVYLFGKQAYLGSEAGYLSVTVEHIGHQLRIGAVAGPQLPEELLSDDSIRATFVDLSSNFLDDTVDLRCTAATLYADEGSDLSEGRLRGIAFRLSNGDSLVFDPYWVQGIRISGEAGLRHLLADAKNLRVLEVAM